MQDIFFFKFPGKSQTQSVFQKLMNDLITTMEENQLWQQILLGFTLDVI